MALVENRNGLSVAATRELAAAFAAETRHYGRLLRLAVRQNRYMRRQDVARLESNAAEWRRHLPEADVARERRRECVSRHWRDLAGEAVVDIDALIAACDAAERPELVRRVGDWRRAASALHRQNGLNSMLARFCLDLVRAETDVLRRGSAEPAGCYDGGGAYERAASASVMERQA